MFQCTVAILGLAVMVFMRFWPDTDLSRALHSRLVVPSARLLARLDRRQIIFCIVIAGLMIIASDLIIAAGSTELVLGYAADLSMYVDILAASLVLAAATRMKSAWKALRTIRLRSGIALMRRVPGRASRHSHRRPQSQLLADNDADGDMPGRLAA